MKIIFLIIFGYLAIGYAGYGVVEVTAGIRHKRMNRFFYGVATLVIVGIVSYFALTVGVDKVEQFGNSLRN